MFLFEPKKFHRRQDLSPAVRFQIACTGLLTSSYGTITEISVRFSISRPFVYHLIHLLREHGARLFDPPLKKNDGLSSSLREMLQLRLIGKCGIEPISELMKRNGFGHSSVGYISQAFKLIGSSLPCTIELGEELCIGVVFASDEVYARRQPILITVDPVSSAILRIELASSRSASDWENHWKRIMENDCYALYVVSDEGTGLQAAQSSLFPELTHQPDTYHGVAHRLGLWNKRLETAAWKAIEKEYEREMVIGSAKTEEIIEKRMNQYYQAQQDAEQKIQLYEDFQFLYHSMLKNLQIFDADGRVHNPRNAEENIRTATDLLQFLDHKAIVKEAKKIERLLPDLLNFLPRAQELVDKIKHQYPAGVLEAFCVGWQANKNAIKAKNIKRKHFYQSREKKWLKSLSEWLSEDFVPLKKEIYQQVDTIVQSSAMVEAINSIVRPYLNTSKNQTSQHLLNLIMFYHNHRKYRAGKRKGYSPMELLTGKTQQKDWLDLLMEHIQEKLPKLAGNLAA